MATPKIPAPTLERVGSHSVTPSANSFDTGREELFAYLVTEWRGVPVRVTVKATRYTYSGGEWSEWRAYATTAREIDTTRPGTRGPEVSTLARSRLSEVCVPLVREWIASDAYTASRRKAFAHHVADYCRKLDAYSEPPSLRLRQLLASVRHELTPDAIAATELTADAWDSFAAARRAISE